MSTPLPAETARSDYDHYSDSLPYWDENKFPLFASGGGEYFLLETDLGSPDFGMIHYHWVGAVDFDTIITSYDSLILSRLIGSYFKRYKRPFWLPAF